MANTSRPFSILSRVGRPPIYPDPKDLAKVADEYFQWCDDHPIETSSRKQTDNNGKAKAGGVNFTTARAYTLDGFCLFARISDWAAFKKAEAHRDSEYLGVIHAIEQTIRDQQVSGALAGVFQANIVARLNGLAEIRKEEIDDQRKQTAGEAIAAILGVDMAKIENR